MLSHKGTITIETEDLMLRKFTINDADAMFNNWARDEEVAKYMRWNAHKSINETRGILINWIRKYDEKSTYYWAIVLKTIKVPVGNIAMFSLSEYDSCAEVVYCIGRSYWGRGIASEALKAVLKFGLIEVNFNRIEAYHAVRNLSSGKVMQKAGMKFEGMMRKKYRSHMGFEDSNLYAILKEDLT